MTPHFFDQDGSTSPSTAVRLTPSVSMYLDVVCRSRGSCVKVEFVGFPNEEERLEILRAVSNNMDLSDEAVEYLFEIARAPKCAHFSGADLQAVRTATSLVTISFTLTLLSCVSGHVLGAASTCA